MSNLSVLLSCGGTAGHINPAISIADTLKTLIPSVEYLFIGGKHGMESTLVANAGYPIETVDVLGFKRKLTLSNINVAVKAITSIYKAGKYVKSFNPGIAIGTGGYASWAAIKAASKQNIPILIHEQNAFPGVTTKQLAKFADVICLSYEASRKYFPDSVQDKIIITGNPISPKLSSIDKQTARKMLSVKDDEIYILSYGGSLGAGKINEAVIKMLSEYISKTSVRFTHATGKSGYESCMKAFSDAGLDKFKNICFKDYIYDMYLHLAAADIVISRAGAISMAEEAFAGKSVILIPSPYVAENHQYKNAAVLRDANAALLLEEKDLTSDSLTTLVKQLIENKTLRSTLSTNIKQYAHPDAALTICEKALSLVGIK